MNGLDWLIQLDRQAFLAINHGTKSAFLDATMPWLTDLGLGYVQALLVLGTGVAIGIKSTERRSLRQVWTTVYSQRAWMGPLLVSLLFSYSSDIVKAVAPRERPWWFYENQHRAGLFRDVEVLTVPGVYALKVRSFPSGHATSSFAIASTISLLALGGRRRRWARGIVWALAALIAFSRMYLASHWPLDVLAGAILGSLCGLAAVIVCRWWANSERIRSTDRPSDADPETRR